MPSELMDLHASSPSSYFSEGLCYPHERQVGFWETESMPENEGLKGERMLQTAGSNLLASWPLASPLDNRMFVGECIDIPSIHLYQNQQVNLRFDKHLIGTGRKVARLFGHDSRTISDLNTNPVSYVMNGKKANMMGPCYENGLFSSPLSELLSQNMMLSPNDAQYVQSVPATSNYEEEEPFESLEEIEAQTIGNLLPSDDDLLSGVTDGFAYIARPSGGDDMEDLDFFSSVGDLDLGEEHKSSDILSGRLGGSSGSIAGEHQSRTLFVRNINSNVEDIELRAIFAQYGDICTLYTACKHRGFVLISYYDLRAARNAMKALQNKPLGNRKLDIHFSIPKDNPSGQDSNQGTLAVSKIDLTVTNDELRQLFGVYGDIKEICEVPHRGHHKLIEFYDVRAADAALHALSRSELAGKRIKLELRHPDGNTCFTQSILELKQDEFSSYLQQSISHTNLTTGFGGPASHGQTTSFSTENSNILEIPSAPMCYPHSLPGYHDDSGNFNSYRSPGLMASNINVFLSVENESYAPPPPHYYTWDDSPKPHGMMWANSPSFVNKICSPQHLQRLHAIHRPPFHTLNTNLPIKSHQVGLAPSIDPYLWDRRHVYAGESPNASSFQPGSHGNMRISGNSLHPLEFVSPNLLPGFGGNRLDLPIVSKVLQSPQQSSIIFPSSAQMYPRMSPFNIPHEQSKVRRNEGVSSQSDNKKQYKLDIDRIIRGEDKRTTLMIKNIPNKYTSKMLLAAIDELHRGTYDFVYLPIDFKNKCNVGYAFINMTDPSLIIPFSQAFNGKKWEKFNSEKVASLAYARIQGKASLIAHFQNSSLMNEDKRCRPILFNTEGPNAGDQVPFPMGVNVRSRTTKNRAGMSDENQLESSSYVNNGEAYFRGDSSSRSSRDAD